nr:MAK10-like protein [Tanacetum cinerariifolium]
MGALPSDTVKNPKLNVNSTSLVLSAHSYLTEDPQYLTRIHSLIIATTICPKQPGEFQNDKLKEEDQEEKDNLKTSIPTLPHHLIHQFHSSPRDAGDVIFIEIILKNDDSCKEEPQVEDPQYLTRIHSSIIATMICPKRPGEFQNDKPKEEDQEEKDNLKTSIPTLPHHLIHQFHSSPRNFTYVIDFMIVDDISSIIDARLSQVVLGKPFDEMSNMNHDPPEGVVRKNKEEIFTMAGDGVRIHLDGVMPPSM